MTTQPESPSATTDKLIASITKARSIIAPLPQHPTAGAASAAVADYLGVATTCLRRAGTGLVLSAGRDGYPLDETVYFVRAAGRAIGHARDELLVFAETGVDDVELVSFVALEEIVTRCTKLAGELEAPVDAE